MLNKANLYYCLIVAGKFLVERLGTFFRFMTITGLLVTTPTKAQKKQIFWVNAIFVKAFIISILTINYSKLC